MYSYQFGIPALDDQLGGLTSGANVLILAPPLSGAERIAYNLSFPSESEYSVLLSTDERASEILNFFKLNGTERRALAIIDAITKSDLPNVPDTDRMKFVASPVDLTGISIKMSKMFAGIVDESLKNPKSGVFPPPIRFCVSSLSTFLMYRKLEVMYQFVHVISAKIKKNEWIGLYTLNNESFDARTISVIKQLMNGVVEVREGTDSFELRVVGLGGRMTPWLPYSFDPNGKLVVEG
jgi:RecA-superfamily ATPases implicated in signal transduction